MVLLVTLVTLTPKEMAEGAQRIYETRVSEVGQKKKGQRLCEFGFLRPALMIDLWKRYVGTYSIFRKLVSSTYTNFVFYWTEVRPSAWKTCPIHPCTNPKSWMYLQCWSFSSPSSLVLCFHPTFSHLLVVSSVLTVDSRPTGFVFDHSIVISFPSITNMGSS